MAKEKTESVKKLPHFKVDCVNGCLRGIVEGGINEIDIEL